eukprot:IDg4038t1
MVFPVLVARQFLITQYVGIYPGVWNLHFGNFKYQKEAVITAKTVFPLLTTENEKDDEDCK